MAERLSRWRWAWQHTKGFRNGPLEASGACLAALVSLALSHSLGSEPDMKELAATVIGSAIVGAVLAPLAEFGWKFTRARIEQDRRELENQAQLLAQSDAAVSDLRATLQAVEDRRPDIQTSLEKAGRDHFLVVRNTGANAAFRAQIRIRERQGFWEGTGHDVVEGYWVQSQGPEAPILHGHEARVRLAMVSKTERTFLYLFHCPIPRHQRTDIVAAWPPSRDHQSKTQPALYFQVVISSSPEMRDAVLRNFVLALDGVRDLPNDWYD